MIPREPLRDIEMIRTTVAGLSRKRDAVYVALTQIYSIHRKWAQSGRAKEMAEAVIIHETPRIDGRVRKSLFRVLIEAGWRGLDGKLRSRYTNALKYALLKRCSTEQLTAFIKGNGGIEKCAQRYLAYRRRRLQANNRVKDGSD
jgi:hypothetical protein